MITVMSTVEILPVGSRALQNPPRGTPSRILTVRLGRNCRPPAGQRARYASYSSFSSIPSPAVAAASDYGLPLGQRLPPKPFPAGLLDSALLRTVLGETPLPRPKKPPKLTEQTASTPGVKVAPLVDVLLSIHALDGKRAELIREFLRALECNDVRALRSFLVVRELARPNTLPIPDRDVAADERERANVIRDIIPMLPPNTFSELFRVLDYKNVREQMQLDMDDLHISVDMFQQTPLGHLVDKYGIRKLFVNLYHTLHTLARLRLEAGHKLQPSDYAVLLRSAGASADILAAKAIAAQHSWSVRHAKSGDVYTEFVKARFLTEHAYTQYDHGRFRVRPLNLQWQKRELSLTAYQRLELLRRTIASRRRLLFGQNPLNERVEEHITRVLRKTKPVVRMVDSLTNAKIHVSEDLICALLVAMSRCGSLRGCNKILSRFGVKMEMTEDSKLVAVLMDSAQELRQRFLSQPGQLMTPTERLLLAVVDGYGCQSEIGAAFHTVDTLSRLYSLEITDNVWIRLCNWTFVMSGWQSVKEWEIVEDFRRIPSPDAADLLWNTMTSPPYNFKPGLAQYYSYVKHTIRRGHIAPAVARLREMKSLYEARLRELEEAAAELSHVRALNSLLRDSDSAQRRDEDGALLRYRRAAAGKWAGWFYIQHCCGRLLDRGGEAGLQVEEDVAVRLIPSVVGDFRGFLPDRPKYRIATGVVELEPEPVRQVEGPRAYKRDRTVCWVPAVEPIKSIQMQYLAKLAQRPRPKPPLFEYRTGASKELFRFPAGALSNRALMDEDGSIHAEWIDREFG